MKFALVNCERKEAQPNLSGVCIGCGNPMVAKCGEVRIKHWAHKRQSSCDSWWERETEWHRNWKNQFQDSWQEVIHHADDGERHIADIETPDGWVIEFQHSHISVDERKSRENFYQKLIWVVDGKRRKGDQKKFFKVLGNISGRWVVNEKYPEVQTTLAEGSILLDWIGSESHVFFDFDQEDLWWLLPKSEPHCAFILPIPRIKFINLHREMGAYGAKEFDLLIKKYTLTPPEPKNTSQKFSL
jgi:competence protein CoiA